MKMLEFVDLVADEVSRQFPGLHSDVCDIMKVDARYTGLRVGSETVRSVINLDRHYRRLERLGIGEVLSNIYNEISASRITWPKIEGRDLEWESVKDTLFGEVALTSSLDEVKLASMPHRNFLDLTLFYKITLPGASLAGGIYTITATNEMLEKWDQTEEDLFSTIQKNNPLAIEDVESVLSGIFSDDDKTSPGKLYVARTSNHFGACAIAYPDFTEKARKIWPEGFFVLPSSKHEILFTGGTLKDADALQGMVKAINRSVVDAKDVLADSIYYFNPEKEILEVVRKTA